MIESFTFVTSSTRARGVSILVGKNIWYIVWMRGKAVGFACESWEVQLILM